LSFIHLSRKIFRKEIYQHQANQKTRVCWGSGEESWREQMKPFSNILF
jgi:hypothetical protein